MSWNGRMTPGIHAVLSENGGDKEIRHEALWDKLEVRVRAALQEIADDPEFTEIRPEVWD